MPLVQVKAISGSDISAAIKASSCALVLLVKVLSTPLIFKVPVSPTVALGHKQVTPLVAKVKSGFGWENPKLPDNTHAKNMKFNKTHDFIIKDMVQLIL
jgi:hypothetical protein